MKIIYFNARVSETLSNSFVSLTSFRGFSINNTLANIVGLKLELLLLTVREKKQPGGSKAFINFTNIYYLLVGKSHCSACLRKCRFSLYLHFVQM